MARTRVYLDNAATTPVDPEVAAEMEKVLRTVFGNPSSSHAPGREARLCLEEARLKVARLLGAAPEEIVFTSGGTEADNMAILGIAWRFRDRGGHIITSAVEHHAVLDTCRFLAEQGFKVTFLPVDGFGRVDPEAVARAVRRDTILITIMHANNEIGTIEPIAEIASIAREKEIPFHTDAVQTVGHIPVRVEELGVDLLSLSAHKMHGPKGVGCLYVRRGVKLAPLFHGGGQERGLRAGTENLPGIVGLGKAAEVAARGLPERGERLRRLREEIVSRVLEEIPDVRLNGHPGQRLPHNVHFSFAGLSGAELVAALDREGVSVSAGAACTSGSPVPSHVLQALGLPPELALGSLRVTLSRMTTEEEVSYFLEVLPRLVAALRRQRDA